MHSTNNNKNELTVFQAVVWLLILLLGYLAIGCSRNFKYRALSFFFDGVPPLNEQKKSSVADSLAHVTRIETIKPDSTKKVQSVWSSHPVLGKSSCATCHDQKQSFRLLNQREKLCIGCHDQFKSTIGHAPVEAGTCAECHNPHGSKYPYMLIMDADSLCFQCHDEEEIRSTEAAIIHAPVETGDCVECHNPHGSKNPHLLVSAEQELCYKCHAREDVNSIGKHEGIGKTLCFECHAPHNADNKYLIR